MKPALIVWMLAAGATAQKPDLDGLDKRDLALLRAVYQRYDANRDGQLEATEFPGSDLQFEAMKRDRDDTVSFEEFATSPTAKRLLLARRAEASAPRERLDERTLALRKFKVLSSFDPNRDGKISRDEWNGSPEAFRIMDANRDGNLDRADQRLLERQIPATERVTLPEFKTRLERPEELFKRLDRNRDQKLTRNEVRSHKIRTAFDYADRNGDGELFEDEVRRLVYGVDRRLDARERRYTKPRAYRVPFDSWDKDDNGRLESSEWLSNKGLFSRVDSNRDAVVTPDEIERYERAVEGSTFIQRFDLNNDGRVTPKEFAGSADAFRRADRNGDGAVTRADS